MKPENTQEEAASIVYDWIVAAIEEELHSEESNVRFQFDNVLTFD